MSSNLFGRALGRISPQVVQADETAQLLHALQAAPGIRFDGGDGPAPAASSVEGDGSARQEEQGIWAHRAGVNCLTIDKFEGR